MTIEQFLKEQEKSRQTRRIGLKRPASSETDLFTRLCSQQLHTDCFKEYRFFKPRKWRFDYAIPRYRIAIEVEGGVWSGGRHIRPQGFLNDMEKYNTAALLGWRVFRTTPDELCRNSTISLLKSAINGSITYGNDQKM